jgi:transcriptional regulator with XRE-family HTH domain
MIGEHLKRQRLRRHLFQSEVAQQLHVHKMTIQNWERNIRIPADEFMPRIIAWLGYDPRFSAKQ